MLVWLTSPAKSKVYNYNFKVIYDIASTCKAFYNNLVEKFFSLYKLKNSSLIESKNGELVSWKGCNKIRPIYKRASITRLNKL
jgi:hypothetical protein